MPLDPEFIQNLLEKEKQKGTGVKTTTGNTPRPRSLQLGPLRWAETSTSCASRGCGSPTLIRVKGIPYCSAHALQELNRLLLDADGIDYSDCNCKSGILSKMNLHGSECEVYIRCKSQPAEAPLESLLDNLL